jgi:ketol-acid reductoisomerase
MPSGTERHLFFEEDGEIEQVKDREIAVIGYGNQGRAQALNLRDSGLSVVVGNRDDRYRRHASDDGFRVVDPQAAVQQADIVFLLIPDEELLALFQEAIAPHLRPRQTLVFASGYNIGFDLLQVPAEVDVLMIAPRMIGVGVRERYLTGEGFFSFIGVHQDVSGHARETLLGLARALGALRAAVWMSFKDEAVLDLFNEQAFGPAFGRVLLDAIDVLISNGLPPEAVLIEMYLSEEMAYTYKKMAQIGLVRQVSLHSRTSQYGAMSRGVRYLGLGIKEKMQATFDEIVSGEFAREWQSKLAKLKFKVIRYFATRQRINRIEKQVRQALRLRAWEDEAWLEDMEALLRSPELRDDEELRRLDDMFEF